MPNRNSFPEDKDGEQFLNSELKRADHDTEKEERITVSDVDEELGFVVNVFQLIFPFLFLVFVVITLMYMLFAVW